MREDELSLLVFLVLDVHLYSVAHLEVWSVAELAACDDALALVANVDNNLTVVDGCYSTIYHLVVVNIVESAFVGCFLSGFV